MICAQGTETAICLGHGELGTYLTLGGFDFNMGNNEQK